MKLTVKLIFTTVLIVALAVSICSYLLLSGSFRSELNMQYEAAMQESTLFSSSMGNMALQTMANSFQDGAQESVERFLQGGVHLKRYAYQVLTGDGTVLSASTRQTPRLSAADAGTILSYWKLRDTVADSSFWRGLPARLLSRLPLPLASCKAAMAEAAVTPEEILPVLVSVLPLVSRSSWMVASSTFI